MTHSTRSLTRETQWPPQGCLSSQEAQQHCPAQFPQHDPTNRRESKYWGFWLNYYVRIDCPEWTYETLTRTWKSTHEREVGRQSCWMSKTETSSPSSSTCREQWAEDSGSECGFPQVLEKISSDFYKSWLRSSTCLPDPPAVNQESRLPDIYQLTRQSCWRILTLTCYRMASRLFLGPKMLSPCSLL